MSNKNDNNSGFQELIDSEFNQRAKAKRKDREREKEKNSNFELFSYLEQENARLDKNALAYLEKFETLKNYPQGQAVCLKANQTIDEQVKLATTEHLSKDSDFIKSLNEAFNLYFNS